MTTTDKPASAPQPALPRRRGRASFRLAGAQILRVGGPRWHWGDTYHWILTLTWPRFISLVTGLYIATNLLFAAAFYAVPGCIANARPGNFLDVFFFSIETLATVGYGYMNPDSVYGHAVASLEILLGMLEVAVVTGLLFARFSRPTSRIVFSEVAVITPFNGVRTLMVRTGNERNNMILEATVKASLVRRETTLEGQVYTRFYDLKLERHQTSVFALSWTIMHSIDASSPLYGKNQQDLVDEGASLMIAISGMDDTLNDIVHARHNYEADEVYPGYRYADILSSREGQIRILDYSKFHDIVPDGLPPA